MKDVKGQSIESYLAEDLLALYPVYDNGDKTAVLTRKCSYTDQRSTVWLIRKLASYYNLDLVSLRRECGGIINIKHNIALPFTNTLILLPVKVRQAAVPGETTNGYVNMLQIKRLVPAATVDESPWLSRVVFKSGVWLKTCNTVDTIKQRQKHGDNLLKAFENKNWQCNCKKYISKAYLIELLKAYDGDHVELFAPLLDLVIQAKMIKLGCK